MPYGNLAKTLVANGYDFDIVNDDLLQHRAAFRDGRIEINGYAYRVLILPRATVVPIETMRAIRDFAQAGGTVVALDELPHDGRRAEELRGERPRVEADRRQASSWRPPGGQSGGIFLPEYKIGRTPFQSRRGSPDSRPRRWTAPQRRLLGRAEPRDAARFCRSGRCRRAERRPDVHPQAHRRRGCLFRLQSRSRIRIATDVTFRVTGKTPQRWNAVTGAISPVPDYRADAGGTTIRAGVRAVGIGVLRVRARRHARGTTARGNRSQTADARAVAHRRRLADEARGVWFRDLGDERRRAWPPGPTLRGRGIFPAPAATRSNSTLPAERLADRARFMLDLGQVGNIAEVELNGQTVGVAWMAPLSARHHPRRPCREEPPGGATSPTRSSTT